MKNGKIDEGAATLRMKITLEEGKLILLLTECDLYPTTERKTSGAFIPHTITLIVFATALRILRIPFALKNFNRGIFFCSYCC